MEYIVVTGAYGGMGKETVKELVSKGYTVFALDRKVYKEENGVIPVEVDITSEESVLNAFNKVSQITNKVSAIIHFAGIYVLDSLVEISEEKFLRIFEVHLFGVFRINKTFIPLLKNGSKILITTSELAPLAPLPFTGLYAITKSALDKYAYSLLMELQLLGVKVCVLRPGAVDTGMIGASVTALDRFCDKTELYSCNAARFKRIVDGVEARRISADRLAKRAVKILEKRRAGFAYSINRNPLLLLLNALPKRLQLFVIRLILK